MKKLSSFKNIELLLNLFINNALNGLLNRPILKKKWIRLTIILVISITYLSYFLYNMRELIKIIPDNNSVDSFILLQGKKITLFSFFSNSFTLAIIISIFINNTLALDKTSIFFVKTLPFSKKDIKFSFFLFKFSVMLLIYELVMLIATPAIQLVTTNPIEYVIFFLSQHIFFVSVIIIVELLKMIMDLLHNSVQRVSIFFLDIILGVGSITYFFNTRYSLEMTLSKTTLTISQLVLVTSILSIVILLIGIWLLIILPSSDRIDNLSKYIKIPFIKGAVLRYKANLNLITFVFVAIGIIFIQSGYRTAMSILPTILSFSGILLLNYADITSDFKKQYSLLRISTFNEWMEQLRIIVILSVPLIVLNYLSYSTWTTLAISISLSSVAIILGYLFPKSKGSLNETSSLFLLMVVCILITLLISNVSYGYLVMGITLAIHYIIIKKVRYENIL